VTHSTAQHPNEYYYNGLRTTDATVFEALYTEYRRAVTRAVEATGGSAADGNTFFRVAALHTASMARNQELDETLPIFYQIKNLAVAHYRDWATEKNLELPVMPAPSEEEANYHISIPGPEARSDFRQGIKARRQLSKLEPNCQKVVREMAKDASIGLNDPRLETDSATACFDKYRQNLGATAEEWQGKLPAWAVSALSDEPFEKAWATAETLEIRLAMGHTAAKPAETKNIRNVFILLALLLTCYWLWNQFGPSKTPKAVYEENFTPPVSIMADRAARLAKNTAPTEQNPVCEQLFEEADKHYQDKAYEEAATILYSIVESDLEGCNSDALFYLAIIALKLEQPGIAIDCLAKIPDLDSFGEDLYWYQALAFVKIAAQNPMQRDIARRAVERARSNTEIPERRAQAEKMLEQLKE
jgi:hypothetical protein